jgi:hypothetical protein
MAIERRRVTRMAPGSRVCIATGCCALAHVGYRLFAPVLAVLFLLAWPSAAVACTRPIWNRPYYPDITTMAAEGWIEGFVPRPDRRVDLGSFTSLDVVVRTEVAHKGQVPDRLIFREDASLVASVDAFGNVLALQWAGSSGACGMFDADPTGSYILVTLREHADLAGPGVALSVGIGHGPSDPWVARLRQEIQSYPPPSDPPRIVSATAGSSLELWAPRLPFLTVVALGLAAAGLVLSLAVSGLVLKWLRSARR